MTHSASLLYPSGLEHLLSTCCMPSVLPGERGYWEGIRSVVLGACNLWWGSPLWLAPPPATSLMSTFSALASPGSAWLPHVAPHAQRGSCEQLPGLSVALVCSFKLARLSSWWVHVGLVSHSMVRPHEGLWWRGSSPFPVLFTVPHTPHFLRRCWPWATGAGCGETEADTGKAGSRADF